MHSTAVPWSLPCPIHQLAQLVVTGSSPLQDYDSLIGKYKQNAVSPWYFPHHLDIHELGKPQFGYGLVRNTATIYCQ